MKRLVLVMALATLPFAAQAQVVVVGGCLPKENPRTCKVECKEGMLLAVAVCNNHGKPGDKKSDFNAGGEVMPSYLSHRSAQCTAPASGYAFGDSMYGICVFPPRRR